MWNEDARMTLYSNKYKPACVCVCVDIPQCECVRGKASRGRVLSGFGTPTTICNGAVPMTLCVCVGLYWICVCVCIRCQSVTEGQQQQAVSVKASLELTTIHASPFPFTCPSPWPNTRHTLFLPLYFFHSLLCLPLLFDAQICPHPWPARCSLCGDSLVLAPTPLCTRQTRSPIRFQCGTIVYCVRFLQWRVNCFNYFRLRGLHFPDIINYLVNSHPIQGALFVAV